MKRKMEGRSMTAKVQTLPPIYTLGVRVFKGFGRRLSKLAARLLRMAGSEESYSIVVFTVTGEVFELQDGGLRRC